MLHIVSVLDIKQKGEEAEASSIISINDLIIFAKHILGNFWCFYSCGFCANPKYALNLLGMNILVANSKKLATDVKACISVRALVKKLTQSSMKTL